MGSLISGGEKNLKILSVCAFEANPHLWRFMAPDGATAGFGAHRAPLQFLNSGWRSQPPQTCSRGWAERLICVSVKKLSEGASV